MGDHHKISADEERARALAWKMFLIIAGAASAFAGAVYFFVL